MNKNVNKIYGNNIENIRYHHPVYCYFNSNLYAFLLGKKYKKKITVKYFFIGAFIMSILISISAVWSDFSNLILLKHYGYNVDYMNYENVLPENREHVKILVTSIMGIGWPLKAVFGFVLMIPYLIILYISKKMIDKMKKS